VRLALSTVDNDTVVMFVSDHGHVDRGGHGGVDSVLLEVPLFIYKRNSYLSQSNSTSDPLSNSGKDLPPATNTIVNSY
jgi:arylsulfatase A-like enzyme